MCEQASTLPLYHKRGLTHALSRLLGLSREGGRMNGGGREGGRGGREAGRQEADRIVSG